MADKRTLLDQIMSSEVEDELTTLQAEKEAAAKRAAFEAEQRALAAKEAEKAAIGKTASLPDDLAYQEKLRQTASQPSQAELRAAEKRPFNTPGSFEKFKSELKDFERLGSAVESPKVVYGGGDPLQGRVSLAESQKSALQEAARIAEERAVLKEANRIKTTYSPDPKMVSAAEREVLKTAAPAAERSLLSYLNKNVLDAVKRNPKLAIGGGLLAAVAAHKGLKNNETSVPEYFPEDENEVEGLGESTGVRGDFDDTDKFLQGIAQNESSGGKFTDHARVSYGGPTGQQAFGVHGILPTTSKEISKRIIAEGGFSPEVNARLAPIEKMDNDQVNRYIEQNPDVEQILVRGLAKRTLDKGGSPLRAAYLWRYGHNKDISNLSDRDLIALDKEGYLKKFAQATGIKLPEEGEKELASRSESTPEDDSPSSHEETPQTASGKGLDVFKALQGGTEDKQSVLSAYRDALARRGGMQLMSDIGKATAQIGAGLAGGVGPGLSVAAPKMDTSVYDSLKQRAEEPIKDFAIERELSKEEALKDPKSPASIQARELLKQLMPDMTVPDTLSAGQLKDAGIDISKIFGGLITQKRDEKKLAGQKELLGMRFDNSKQMAKIRSDLSLDTRLAVKEKGELNKDQAEYNSKNLKGPYQKQLQNLQALDRLSTILDRVKAGEVTIPQITKDASSIMAQVATQASISNLATQRATDLGLLDSWIAAKQQWASGKAVDDKTLTKLMPVLESFVHYEAGTAAASLIGGFDTTRKLHLEKHKSNPHAKSYIDGYYNTAVEPYLGVLDRAAAQGMLSNTALHNLPKDIRVKYDPSMAEESSPEAKTPSSVQTQTSSVKDTVPNKKGYPPGYRLSTSKGIYVVDPSGKTMVRQ